MYNPSSDRKNIEIDIDTVYFLYDISKKYKVYASDILYPTDMKDLLNRLGDKSFYLPFLIRLMKKMIVSILLRNMDTF